MEHRNLKSKITRSVTSGAERTLGELTGVMGYEAELRNQDVNPK